MILAEVERLAASKNVKFLETSGKHPFDLKKHTQVFCHLKINISNAGISCTHLHVYRKVTTARPPTARGTSRQFLPRNSKTDITEQLIDCRLNAQYRYDCCVVQTYGAHSCAQTVLISPLRYL